MSIFSRFLPKKKPPEIKNNIPKEKANIKKTFAVYCHKEHDTSGDKLCPKCTALLATVLMKMNRCPYGITKPICDRCESPCFSKSQNIEFRKIMTANQKSMLLRHPIMTIKHKLASMGVDYALKERAKKEQQKVEAKEKAAKRREEARSKKKK